MENKIIYQNISVLIEGQGSANIDCVIHVEDFNPLGKNIEITSFVMTNHSNNAARVERISYLYLESVDFSTVHYPLSSTGLSVVAAINRNRVVIPRAYQGSWVIQNLALPVMNDLRIGIEMLMAQPLISGQNIRYEICIGYKYGS